MKMIDVVLSFYPVGEGHRCRIHDALTGCDVDILVRMIWSHLRVLYAALPPGHALRVTDKLLPERLPPLADDPSASLGRWQDRLDAAWRENNPGAADGLTLRDRLVFGMLRTGSNEPETPERLIWACTHGLVPQP